MTGSETPPPGWYPSPDGGSRWWDGAQFTESTPGPPASAGSTQEHPDGTTVFVLGILGILLCGVLGPFAWAKGSRALRDIDAEPSKYTNRGQVQAGRILGIISTVLLCGSMILGVLLVAGTVATREDSSSSPSPTISSDSSLVTTTDDFSGPKNWQNGVGDAVGENGVDAQERAESAPGVYIWTDFQGWHVRSNNESEVTVTVTADQVRELRTDDYDADDEDGELSSRPRWCSRSQRVMGPPGPVSTSVRRTWSSSR